MRVRTPPASICVVALCAALALSQSGCGRKAFSAEVPASELLAGIHANAAPLILDVRTPEEYARGHVPGALNIRVDELAARIEEISAQRSDEVVVYCERGPRAERAADLLTASGFTSVRHLEGDMSGWRAAGLPTDGSGR